MALSQKVKKPTGLILLLDLTRHGGGRKVEFDAHCRAGVLGRAGVAMLLMYLNLRAQRPISHVSN